MDPMDFISIDVFDGNARWLRTLPAGNQGNVMPLVCKKLSKLV
jgi:hypothetical protein